MSTFFPESLGCPGDWTSNNGCCGRCAVHRDDHAPSPGVYRLTRDVAAPTPDKRERHDWRKAPAASGTLFAVRDEREFTGKVVVAKLSGFSTHCIDVTSAKASELLAHLEPVEETPSLWLEFVECPMAAAEMLDALVSSGKLTMADVRHALTLVREVAQ